MRFAGEILGILAQHLLNSFNPSRQTKALKRAVHILPSRRKAGHERERGGRGSAGHGAALLCGFGPEPNGSRWATPPSLVQQQPGHSPLRCSVELLTKYSSNMISLPR